MGSPGYVYVLVNPSLPNCVKIGKTRVDPSSRAGELSSATGVPTPFIVAYDAYLKDCDAGESFVHALLESQGVRLSKNREFFSVTPTQAIKAVAQAQARFGSDENSGQGVDGESEEYEDPDLSELSVSSSDNDTEPWESVLDEAHDYDYGSDDVLEDKNKAVEKYKLAAKLGSVQAFLRLGEIYADDFNNKATGVEWLKRGADRGLMECWVELGNVFEGTNIYFGSDNINSENAIKCFRKYLRSEDLIIHGNRGSMPYAVFKRYLALLAKSQQNQKGEEIAYLVSKIHKLIMDIGDKDETAAKLSEFNELLKMYDFTSKL